MQENVFSPLFDATAGRLRIARQVVLAKWDSQQPIEDPTREEVVISTAASMSRKLSRPFTN